MLMAILIAACASTTPQQGPIDLPVWPEPPAPPRVTFVRSFTTAEDLGIVRSVWQRIGELLFGPGDSGLVRPMAVVASGGLVYVADPGVRGVHRFDRVEGRHEILRDESGRMLPSPVGLALGTEGKVYVTDSALRKVFVIRPGAKSAVALDLSAELRQPTGIAVDPISGRLYVVDTADHHIKLFESDGRLAGVIGERGEGDGQFNFPTLLWRDRSGQLYVTDSLNFRVQLLDGQGRFLSKFGRHGDVSGDLARHKGVATDRYGHVYVVDSLLHMLQIFDLEGRLLLGIGVQGRERGEFWLPVGLYISDDDTIYVADSYNRRVQMFRYVGGPG